MNPFGDGDVERAVRHAARAM